MRRTSAICIALSMILGMVAAAPAAMANGISKFEFDKNAPVEGPEGSSLVVAIRRHADTKGTSSVRFTTSNGTATAGSDYVDSDQTVTFTDKQSEKNVTIPLIGDTLLEGNETLVLALGAPVTNGEVHKPGSYTATITDEDVVELSIANAPAIVEGSIAQFTITASNTNGGSAQWATSDGTATAPGDYPSQSGTVTIPAGSSTGTISVTTTDDALDEPDETFEVTLSNPGAGTALDPSASDATGTIQDNDEAPGVTISNNPSIAEGGDLDYEIELSGPSGKAITVTVQTDAAFSIAQAPGDYTPKTETLNFAPGDTLMHFLVDTNDDNLDEAESTLGPGELLWAHITGATNATLPTDFTTNMATDDRWGAGFITDDDLPPVVTMSNNPQVMEGGDLSYAVTLSGPSERAITVTVQTDAGTSEAQPPGDYTSKTEILHFAPGETVEQFVVSTNDDALDEPDSTLGPGELLWAHITGATNATLPPDFTTNLATNDRWGAGFIGDNDEAPVVTISNNPSAAEGGDLEYTVSLSAPSGKAITVTVETDQGSSQAQPPGDYTATTQTLHFAPGETTKIFTVDTHDDNVFDNTSLLATGELVWTHITNATNATLPPDFTTNMATDDRWGAGFVIDNDSMPVVTMSNNPNTTEGNPLDHALSLSNPSDQLITVTVKTDEGFSQAQPPGDYTAKTETLSFAPGSTLQLFSVTTHTDGVTEAPSPLGPGELVWAHIISASSNVTLPTDFINNASTNDRWSTGFIADA